MIDDPAISPTTGTTPRLAIAVVAVGVIVAFLIAASLPGHHAPVTYRFVIPAGTGQALAAGANISLFPERMVIDRGDIIDLVNEDDRDDEVGPFFVAANSELRQSVNRAGTYSGTCTLHRSGRVVIVVR
jgi:hypothetical protein